MMQSSMQDGNSTSIRTQTSHPLSVLPLFMSAQSGLQCDAFCVFVRSPSLASLQVR